jgi:serine/threonine-protein kinase
MTSDQALGKYRLIAEIGRGGMADVYLAVVQGPAGFNKLVVIKKTRPELARDAEFLTMFLDEARLAARLNHPNVVHTTEVGQDGDRYFIAMEYLDGQPLNRIRSRCHAAFPLSMQVRVMADTLAGLHHAHELCDFDGTRLEVVHRDATPQNVFVTYDGVIKVVDFGIAKAVDSSIETRSGIVKGKVTYMAPEQARGERVDRRADVFAVGVMLWEGIVGRRMWKGMPDLSVIHELLNGRLPSLRDAAPDAPDALVKIVERALARSADDRYPTALDMHDALIQFLEESGAKSASARDVGKFVAEKFADDRVKVKGIIEAQLRDVRWTGTYPRATGLDLPKIDPGPLLVTPTGAGELAPTRAVATHPSARSGESQPSHSLTNAASALSAAPPPSPAARKSGMAVFAGIAAIASAAVIVVGVRFLAPKEKAPSTVAATTEAQTAVAPTSGPGATAPTAPRGPAAAEAVKLVVRVTPAHAKVYLDDALLGAGTFEGKVVRTDAERRVRVEAPHFVTREERVSLTGDLVLTIALEKEAAGIAPPGAPGAGGPLHPKTATPPVQPEPPPPPSVTAAPPPAGPGQKPRRPIDPESPYAQ